MRVRCIRCGRDNLDSMNPGREFDPEGKLSGSMAEFLIMPGMPHRWNRCVDCRFEFLPEQVQYFGDIPDKEIFVYLPETWARKKDKTRKDPVLYQKDCGIITNAATNLATGINCCLDSKAQILKVNDLFNLFFKF